MPPRVGGTLAPDQNVLRRLAEASGDPLRAPDVAKGRPLDRRLMKLVNDAGGHCIYLPELCSPLHDFATLEALALDVAAAGERLVPHRTNKRLQVFAEDLKDSTLFRSLISKSLSATNMSLVDAWVNVYRDGRETTGWHQDHYNLRVPHACATLNLNLGATRQLAFEHLATGEKFYVPQENGSLFAFDARCNLACRHSVPVEPALAAEPGSLRLSITMFAIEGPQPESVSRDSGNVPPGVPLNVSLLDLRLPCVAMDPSTLPASRGAGAELLLSNGGPLLRGHDRKGKGKSNARAGHSEQDAHARAPARKGKGEALGKHSKHAVVEAAAEAAAQAKAPAAARWRAAPDAAAKGEERPGGTARRWQRRAGATAVASDAERRQDSDGICYTKAEFRFHYGGYHEWDRAKPMA